MTLFPGNYFERTEAYLSAAWHLGQRYAKRPRLLEVHARTLVEDFDLFYLPVGQNSISKGIREDAKYETLRLLLHAANEPAAFDAQALKMRNDAEQGAASRERERRIREEKKLNNELGIFTYQFNKEIDELGRKKC